MININLLPPQIKEDIAYSKRNAILKKILIKIIFVLFIFTLAFLGTYMVFINKISDLESSIKKEEEKLELFETLKEDAGKLKEKLDLVKKIRNDYPYWTVVLDEIQEKIPYDVYLTEISASKEASERVELKGAAKTKQSIANFRKSLEESEKFENIDVNTVTKGDQEEIFNIKLSLKKEALE